MPVTKVGFTVGERNPVDTKIGLDIEFYDQPIPKHHLFLNEAKLSALALSIFLASLKIQPAASLKLLALDDVLIGLDMSNRLPVLNILEEHFSDYQILLSTYDRVWYEMVKLRMERKNWKNIEFFVGRTSTFDLPVFAGDRSYLDRAREYANRSDGSPPDHKAAAVYARTHFEIVLKKFCDKKHVKVGYYENRKDMDSDVFWSVVKEYRINSDSENLLVSEGLKNKIEHSRKRVLNPLSHSEVGDFFIKEIEEAINAVAELQGILDPDSLNKKSEESEEKKERRLQVEESKRRYKESIGRYNPEENKNPLYLSRISVIKSLQCICDYCVGNEMELVDNVKIKQDN